MGARGIPRPLEPSGPQLVAEMPINRRGQAPLGPSREPGLSGPGGLSRHPASGCHPTTLGPTSSTPSAPAPAPPRGAEAARRTARAGRQTQQGPCSPPVSPSSHATLARSPRRHQEGTASVSVLALGPGTAGGRVRPAWGLRWCSGRPAGQGHPGAGAGRRGSWLRVGACRGSPRSPAQRQGQPGLSRQL